MTFKSVVDYLAKANPFQEVSVHRAFDYRRGDSEGFLLRFETGAQTLVKIALFATHIHIQKKPETAEAEEHLSIHQGTSFCIQSSLSLVSSCLLYKSIPIDRSGQPQPHAQNRLLNFAARALSGISDMASASVHLLAHASFFSKDPTANELILLPEIVLLELAAQYGEKAIPSMGKAFRISALFKSLCLLESTSFGTRNLPDLAFNL